MKVLFDARGNEVVLGRCLGRGGEGAVYALAHRPRLAAKVYTVRPDDARRRKLEAMISIGAPGLSRVAAWPCEPLLLEPGGETAGFLMPRLTRHRPLHALYGPAARKREFPDASFRFLVRAARNLAAAFDTVHAHGHVVGDVNQGNALVSECATVVLIDCDSFQVTVGSERFACGVGVALFTPPELSGRSLEQVPRERDHDAFGLAVLVFQLLFMGRHPYAGCRPGFEVSVESAIRDGSFVFGWQALGEGWTPPPFSLRLSDLPLRAALLFERAFARGSSAGSRPTPAEWVTVLDELEAALAACETDPRHVHGHPGGRCPWCRIEGEGGPTFFVPATSVGAGPVDVARAWRRVDSVPSPGPAGPPPAAAPARRLRGRPLPTALAYKRRWRYLAAAASATFACASVALRDPAGGLGLVGLWALRPTEEELGEREARQQAVDACRSELRAQHARWARECGDAGFSSRRRELERARRAIDALKQLEQQERRHLGRRVARARQRRYLAGFPLAAAPIACLDEPGRQQLSQWGIASAADVDTTRLARLHRSAPQLEAALVAWRDTLARGFAPATAGLEASDVRALEERQRQRRESLERVLCGGVDELVACRQAVIARRRDLGAVIARTQARLAQLEADLACA